MPYILQYQEIIVTKSPKMGGGTGSMVKNFYLGSLLCKIELESVSAAVRADNNLNKVHSF